MEGEVDKEEFGKGLEELHHNLKKLYLGHLATLFFIVSIYVSIVFVILNGEIFKKSLGKFFTFLGFENISISTFGLVVFMSIIAVLCTIIYYHFYEKYLSGYTWERLNDEKEELFERNGLNEIYNREREKRKLKGNFYERNVKRYKMFVYFFNIWVGSLEVMFVMIMIDYILKSNFIHLIFIILAYIYILMWNFFIMKKFEKKIEDLFCKKKENFEKYLGDCE